jgi:hypothetical protein
MTFPALILSGTKRPTYSGIELRVTDAADTAREGLQIRWPSYSRQPGGECLVKKKNAEKNRARLISDGAGHPEQDTTSPMPPTWKPTDDDTQPRAALSPQQCQPL